MKTTLKLAIEQFKAVEDEFNELRYNIADEFRDNRIDEVLPKIDRLLFLKCELKGLEELVVTDGKE